MKTYTRILLSFLVIGMLALTSCVEKPTLAPTQAGATTTSLPPTSTLPPSQYVGKPTLTPTQSGATATSLPPTSALPPSQSLQLGNNLPHAQISPRISQELPDNHIGAWFEDFSRFYDTNFVYRLGFKRVHIDSLAGSGQDFFAAINSETLSPEIDNTISEYADNGVEIELILGSGAGVTIHYTDYDTTFKSEEDINAYLEYVSFIVQHFKGRISSYELLNEPGYISVETYANLVKATVPIIRGIDPDAKIIIGSVPGSWENGFPGYGEYQRFELYIDTMNELLQSGVVSMVDGISWHPFFDNIPSDPYYQNYPQMVQGIKELATSQGFTGEYFAYDILWQTVDEPDWDNGPPVTPPIAAKYFTRAITENRGLGANVTINTWFLEPERKNVPKTALSPIHNLCDTLAGAEPTDMTLSLKTDEDANVRYYAFTLPDGDTLVALWTNDEAVEKDPGVSATLTFPGSSAQSVTGVDVFNGFEQELITETVGSDLVIRNLLVKDYPIILRFSAASFAEPGTVEPTVAPLEPVTIKLRKDTQEHVPAGTPIQLTIGWLADSQEHVADFLAVASLHGTLDGQPLPDLDGYWGSIVPYQDKGYLTQWLYLLDVLSPGTHNLEIWCTLSQPVTDGSDVYSSEVWRISMQIVVY
jgi:hypothetical protein